MINTYLQIMKHAFFKQWLNYMTEFILFYIQVCSVEFDRKDINMNKLVATSLEGKFHVFDMRTQHPTKGFASVSEKVWGD